MCNHWNIKGYFNHPYWNKFSRPLNITGDRLIALEKWNKFYKEENITIIDLRFALIHPYVTYAILVCVKVLITHT